MLNFSHKRRLFITHFPILLSAGSALAGCSDQKPTASTLLNAIVDTLIPRDDSPGALDLGLDQKLLQLINRNPERHANLNVFAGRINEISIAQVQTGFTKLSSSKREAMLTTILDEPGQSTNKRALLKLRGYILGWYYRSETGHRSLGYTAPNKYQVTHK